MSTGAGVGVGMGMGGAWAGRGAAVGLTLRRAQRGGFARWGVRQLHSRPGHPRHGKELRGMGTNSGCPCRAAPDLLQ